LENAWTNTKGPKCVCTRDLLPAPTERCSNPKSDRFPDAPGDYRVSVYGQTASLEGRFSLDYNVILAVSAVRSPPAGSLRLLLPVAAAYSSDGNQHCSIVTGAVETFGGLNRSGMEDDFQKQWFVPDSFRRVRIQVGPLSPWSWIKVPGWVSKLGSSTSRARSRTQPAISDAARNTGGVDFCHGFHRRARIPSRRNEFRRVAPAECR
jgi:hypothetical protein